MPGIAKTLEALKSSYFPQPTTASCTDDPEIGVYTGSLAYISFDVAPENAISVAQELKSFLARRGVTLVPGGIETIEPSLTVYFDLADQLAHITMHNVDDDVLHL